jgi:hypothetical protein
MKKDIVRPKVEDVSMAVVLEKDAANGQPREWAVYLINRKDVALRNVLIASKGYGNIDGQEIRTSVLRHFFEDVGPQSSTKVERIMEDVFGLNNEYMLSFYIGSDIYDRKYIFVPESVNDGNLVKVPILGLKGVLIA